MSQVAIEKQMFAVDKGPRMLPRRARIRVWAALSGIFLWFYGCFRLVAYRLRSDDLELMEREVYEELRMKKEVERFMNQNRREDELKKGIKLPGQGAALDPVG